MHVCILARKISVKSTKEKRDALHIAHTASSAEVPIEEYVPTSPIRLNRMAVMANHGRANLGAPAQGCRLGNRAMGAARAVLRAVVRVDYALGAVSAGSLNVGDRGRTDLPGGRGRDRLLAIIWRSARRQRESLPNNDVV